MFWKFILVLKWITLKIFPRLHEERVNSAKLAQLTHISPAFVIFYSKTSLENEKPLTSRLNSFELTWSSMMHNYQERTFASRTTNEGKHSFDFLLQDKILYIKLFSKISWKKRQTSFPSIENETASRTRSRQTVKIISFSRKLLFTTT